MSIQTLQPPLTPASALNETIQQQGFAVLSPQSVAQLSGASLDDLSALEASWQFLAPDQYLKDGGRYRYRRHGSYVISGEEISSVPHRAHWQPLSYNALHGGMHRWFELSNRMSRNQRLGKHSCVFWVMSPARCMARRLGMPKRISFASIRQMASADPPLKVRIGMAFILWLCFWWGVITSKGARPGYST